MFKLHFAAAAFLAATATAAIAAAPAAPGKGPAKVETRAAIPADVARTFTALDSNRDGFVTQAEIDAKASARTG